MSRPSWRAGGLYWRSFYAPKGFKGVWHVGGYEVTSEIITRRRLKRKRAVAKNRIKKHGVQVKSATKRAAKPRRTVETFTTVYP